MDLDSEKENIVKQFRRNVQDVLKPWHDDRFLLRWLRARNYKLENAESMLRKDMKFRQKFGSDTLVGRYEIRKSLIPYIVTAFLGFSKHGHPIRMFNLRGADIKGLSRLATLNEIIEYMIFSLEKDRMLLKEQNEKHGRNIETGIYIADLKNFKMTQAYDQHVIQLALRLVRIYQDHYPETLHTIYVLNAPRFFTYALEFFTPFLDEVVQRKFKVFGADGWCEEILSFVPKEIFPAYLGGTRCDPKEDPYCNGFLNFHDKIPQSLYLKKPAPMKKDDPGVNLVIIPPGSVFKFSHEITTLYDTIYWKFQVTNYDIRFGLYFGPSKNMTDDPDEISALEKVDCKETPHAGKYYCDEVGTYILIFDNSNSWIRAKHLLYKIDVHSSNRICEHEL